MEVLKEEKMEWSARIRCIRHRDGYPQGCFSVIKINKDDIETSTDYDGDPYFWIKCPVCGNVIYFERQLTEIIEQMEKEFRANRKSA